MSCLVTALQDFIIQVREAHNFGLAPRVALVQPWGLGVEELAHIDVKHRQNLWTGTNGYCIEPNPVSAKFTEAHEKKFGLPPGYAAVAAYGMTRLVLRGIERAKSAEPVEVIKAFEGWETEDWPGTVRINPQTHQTERNYFSCAASGRMRCNIPTTIPRSGAALYPLCRQSSMSVRRSARFKDVSLRPRPCPEALRRV